MDDTRTTFDLDDVEIFRAGSWNGDTYSEDDLDEMVKSFNEIGAITKPYLKLGHDSNQALLQKDGLPAAGWITGLKRNGKSLYASIKNIPEKVYQLIEKKAYGRFSSEIFWNLKHEGKTHRRSLKAVALLGASTPAIGSMDDFINLYTESEYEVIKNYHEVNDMDDLKKYTDQIADLSEKLAKFGLDVESLKSENGKLKAEKDALQKDVQAKEYARKESEVKAFFDSALQAGKILPSQVKEFMALALGDGVHEYSFIENNAPGKVSGNGFDLVKSIIENNPKIVEFSSESKHVQIEKKTYSKDENAEDILDKRIKEYAEKNKVKYADAFDAVASEIAAEKASKEV